MLSEVEEARYQVCVNCLLDGRLVLEGEQLAETSSCKRLHHLNVGLDQVADLWEVIEID